MLGFGQMLADQAAASASTLAVSDVFAATAYSGTGTARNLTTGINLTSTGTAPLGTGGLIWMKCRNNSSNHALHDSARSAVTHSLSSNITSASTISSGQLSAFGTTGVTLGASTNTNGVGFTYVAWSFRKAAGFFDIVTGFGNGAAQTLNHNLGVTPGLIIVRPYTTTANWYVYHASGGISTVYTLNAITAATASFGTHWGGVAPTATQFTLGTANSINGQSFIAYLFANDLSPDGVCRTGYYDGNGSASGPTINLGWRPQYLLIKNHGAAGDWMIFDAARGFDAGSDLYLRANTTGLDTNGGALVSRSDSGFQITNAASIINTDGSAYIYMAIRSAA